jgi:hypothetical protein
VYSAWRFIRTYARIVPTHARPYKSDDYDIHMTVFITLTTVQLVRSIDTVTFKITLPREGNAASIAAPKLVFCARPETREYHYHYHCSRRVKDSLTGVSASEQQAT